MSDRELILSRVRAALAGDKHAPRSHHEHLGPRSSIDASRSTPVVPPVVDDSLVRLVTADVDLRSRFIETANRTGMKASRATHESLSSSLIAILREEAPKTVLVDVIDSSLRPVVGDACRTLGISTSTDHDARAFDADLAIIDASAAVAETGSVLLTSDGRRRCAWIVPPKVVMLVRACTLVPDLLDLWCAPASAASAFASSPPAAMLLVTGPSKTADIEGVLVTGVHGPGTVHVLLVD